MVTRATCAGYDAEPRCSIGCLAVGLPTGRFLLAVEVAGRQGDPGDRIGCGQAETAPEPLSVPALQDNAEYFHQARRVLNAAADRYLFPVGLDWFAPGYT
jgi:hypothetical protein